MLFYSFIALHKIITQKQNMIDYYYTKLNVNRLKIIKYKEKIISVSFYFHDLWCIYTRIYTNLVIINQTRFLINDKNK